MHQEYFEIDEWKIIERDFNPQHRLVSESIFSLGNEHMGLRGFFEEDYSGKSMLGTYLAGVYYPDPTKVGWWKNGYPEFFAKVINATNWAGIRIFLDDEAVDPATGSVSDFLVELDMKTGLLRREYSWCSPQGRRAKLRFERFLSMNQVELAVVRCDVQVLEGVEQVILEPYLDGGIVNQDSNYGDSFWQPLASGEKDGLIFLTNQTKKTQYRTTASFGLELRLDEVLVSPQSELKIEESFASRCLRYPVAAGQVLSLHKYVAVTTSRDHIPEAVESESLALCAEAVAAGCASLFEAHSRVWDEKWRESDVSIEGDPKAQQGIRYNIFQLQQTYAGRDSRLNIGPKGFTGEKYGGCTYWDTEAFCFPFYLYTNKDVALNLLMYRYQHLEAAKNNAKLLGLDGALYPMVTIDGRECHNEWEITFEEIHRNGAIAYAIYHYATYTGDYSYIDSYGIEVLCEIAKFWQSRSSFSQPKQAYVILGVTGPNEYENNVNNNWYTNMLARWCLQYAGQQIKRLSTENPELAKRWRDKLGLTDAVLERWQDVAERMYAPRDESLRIYLQQEGYLDKEQRLVSDLAEGDYPLHKNWSWDRILRSCYIKQADVLQGLYFFPHLVDQDEMRRSFDFYEPRTVHESSLSPSVYSIIASYCGYQDKAYELYLRTARLDLDNYNHDTDDGCHVTSMVGSWLAIVQGFAGLRFEGQQLSFNPYVPSQWQSYQFNFNYQNRAMTVRVDQRYFTLTLHQGEDLTVQVGKQGYRVSQTQALKLEL